MELALAFRTNLEELPRGRLAGPTARTLYLSPRRRRSSVASRDALPMWLWRRSPAVRPSGVEPKLGRDGSSGWNGYALSIGVANDRLSKSLLSAIRSNPMVLRPPRLLDPCWTELRRCAESRDSSDAVPFCSLSVLGESFPRKLSILSASMSQKVDLDCLAPPAHTPPPRAAGNPDELGSPVSQYCFRHRTRWFPLGTFTHLHTGKTFPAQARANGHRSPVISAEGPENSMTKVGYSSVVNTRAICPYTWRQDPVL